MLRRDEPSSADRARRRGLRVSLRVRLDQVGKKGYALGFEALLSMLHGLAPKNHVIEQALREEVRMFPKQALRELIANALVHQDYSLTGMSVMIEMYQLPSPDFRVGDVRTTSVMFAHKGFKDMSKADVDSTDRCKTLEPA